MNAHSIITHNMANNYSIDDVLVGNKTYILLQGCLCLLRFLNKHSCWQKKMSQLLCYGWHCQVKCLWMESGNLKQRSCALFASDYGDHADAEVW